MIAYEDRLNQDVRWAFLEGSRHFDRSNLVHKSMETIAHQLEKRQIPYAVAEPMAMFFHGYRRFTEEIEILVSHDGLAAIQAEPECFKILGSSDGKVFRVIETGVRINFFASGEFPGNRKPKPIKCPDPAKTHVLIDGIRFLSLSALINLLLASGITSRSRMQDIADVLELIERTNLPFGFADHLDPFVQDKFRELKTIIDENIDQV